MYETWFMGIKIVSNIPEHVIGTMLARSTTNADFMTWYQNQLKNNGAGS